MTRTSLIDLSATTLKRTYKRRTVSVRTSFAPVGVMLSGVTFRGPLILNCFLLTARDL